MVTINFFIMMMMMITNNNNAAHYDTNGKCSNVIEKECVSNNR